MLFLYIEQAPLHQTQCRFSHHLPLSLVTSMGSWIHPDNMYQWKEDLEMGVLAAVGLYYKLQFCSVKAGTHGTDVASAWLFSVSAQL